VVYFHVQSSEGGSPRLSRLRSASVGPQRTDFDYVLMHMKFMGYHKLISADGH
jgi:hypothetical protein